MERIAQLESENERLKQLIVVDALTELGNRRGWDEGRNKLVEMMQRHGDKGTLVCLIIDVDDFKQVNDGYGHKNGDIALQKIAGVIKGVFGRNEDVVARFGGDEFGAMGVVEDLDMGKGMAEEIRTGVEKIRIEDVNRSLSVSIGIAAIDVSKLRNELGDVDTRAVVSKIGEIADRGAYVAKDMGRNRVAFG